MDFPDEVDDHLDFLFDGFHPLESWKNFRRRAKTRLEKDSHQLIEV